VQEGHFPRQIFWQGGHADRMLVVPTAFIGPGLVGVQCWIMTKKSGLARGAAQVDQGPFGLQQVDRVAVGERVLVTWGDVECACARESFPFSTGSRCELPMLHTRPGP